MAAKVADCPRCGTRGRRLKPVTLPALLRSDVPVGAEVFRFCKAPDCDVAWFGEQSGCILLVSAAKIRVGQKETAADRPICYCFGHSAADIANAGGSVVLDAITEHCRQGDDRCAETNPQGSCCLGNVRAVMAAGG